MLLRQRPLQGTTWSGASAVHETGREREREREETINRGGGGLSYRLKTAFSRLCSFETVFFRRLREFGAAHAWHHRRIRFQWA